MKVPGRPFYILFGGFIEWVNEMQMTVGIPAEYLCIFYGRKMAHAWEKRICRLSALLLSVFIVSTLP